MGTRIFSITGLIVFGIALFLGGMFFGQTQASASAFYPGSTMMSNDSLAKSDGFGNMLGNGGFGMMGGNDATFDNNFGATSGGYGMMGGGMIGSGMMGSFDLSDADPLSIEEAETAVNDYLTSRNDDNLTLGEIMIFDNQAYAQVMDKNSGEGAFELLIDPVTVNVFPEPGPNMMWNTEYSSMTGMMGAGMMGGGSMMGSGNMMGNFGFTPGGDSDVTAAEAVQIAQVYLDTAVPGTTASDDVTVFPGYYTLHIEEDGEITGMMSVNATGGAVFPHFWHGDFITMSEHK